MKKLFILSFASVLLLTGCGATETLSCSYETNASNGSSTVKYDIDHEGNEVKKVRVTYNYDFNTNNGANTGTNDTDGTTGNTGDTTARARVGDNNNNNNNNGMTNGTNDDNNNNVVGDSDFGANEGTRNGTNNTNGMTDNNTDGNNNGITTYNNDNTNTNNNTNNNNVTNNNNNNDGHTDGVGTGTDGTTSDSQMDDDGVVDGIVGSAIDTIVGTVTDIILDSAGLRDRHAAVQNTYGNVAGFSVQNTNDANNNYKVTYVIDYDTISDDDLTRFNLSRDLDDLRDSYVNQGFTCK